jgi:hypothetical protein
VGGDRYAGEFLRELFSRKQGIAYEVGGKPKSDLFRDLLPLLNAGRIVLPKSDRLAAQLCGLRPRPARRLGKTRWRARRPPLLGARRPFAPITAGSITTMRLRFSRSASIRPCAKWPFLPHNPLKFMCFQICCTYVT